jgi:N-acetyl-gamma-glutamyl-phosphate reductase
MSVQDTAALLCRYKSGLMKAIRVGLVGATGYTGVELMRLLSAHPYARLTAATSRGERGKQVSEIFPSLSGRIDLVYADPQDAKLQDCDAVFFAAPNGTAMETVPDLLKKGVRIIDLAADFRLKDAASWEAWYGMPHRCPDVLAEAVYGLPEINRAAIAQAQLVANPGCYPTAVILGLLPLVEKQLVDVKCLIADAKSGVSGAGRKADLSVAYCETADNFRAYSASRHRHHPEMVQALSTVANTPVGLTFVPHLMPVNRGIHATLYGQLADLELSVDSIRQLYRSRYLDEPFVEVCGPEVHPDTRSVRGANLCRLSVHRPLNGGTVVVLSVIDNLVKGAAGQAVQNMNLMFGCEETTGLSDRPLVP